MNALDGKVLVTGANGHIGANLVHALLDEQVPVRVLIRRGASSENLKGLPIEVVHGDVCINEDFSRAVDGVRFVFHLASPTTITSDLSEVVQAGIRNLLTACARYKVEKVVYTSSAVTIGFSPSDVRLLNENDDYFVPASQYHIVKYRVERELMDLSSQLPFSLVLVNPTTVVGRFDSKITPSTMPAHIAQKNRLAFWFDSGVTIAPVRNVAQGHIQAMKYGKSGNRYILGGENLLIRDYFAKINTINHSRGLFVKIPDLFMYGAGALFSVVQMMGYDRVPFDLSRIRALIGKYGYYSSEKARNDLGYIVGSAESAVQDYYTWLSKKHER